MYSKLSIIHVVAYLQSPNLSIWTFEQRMETRERLKTIIIAYW